MKIVIPIVIPIVIFHSITIWYNIVLWYYRSISERCIWTVHTLLNSLSRYHFYHFLSVLHHQVNRLFALIFVAVLFMVLFWDPLVVCIFSCGSHWHRCQILHVASFWKLFFFESIWSLCVLSLACIIRAICCINIDTIGIRV